MNKDVYKIGYWFSILSFAGAIGYTIAQIFSPPLIQFFKFPWNEILIVLPSIILSISYVVVLSCLHYVTPDNRKIYSQIALTFAIMYSVIVSSVYILQLATVIPGTLNGNGEIVKMFSIIHSQPTQAVDGLGYMFLGVSAFFAHKVFGKNGLEGKARRYLLWHGLIAPFSIIPLWIPPVIVVSMLWFITAPLSLFWVAKYFKYKLLSNK
ncbi:MAG: hypothetical protein ACD_40C00092G0005 [uncultured bacterium]|nr:MAG: hypothetical protein ACD_40C00092G0005 [uncultured bacterium]